MPFKNYKYYLLTIMLLVGAVSVFDRFIFALALQPIKQDLSLTDTQLGFMSGIAFAAFYALAGIPIARWADNGNRITLATITTGLVGLMVAICGTVTNFYQMLMARAGVAVGEAGCMPTAQSLLADYFDRSERPQAMAIYAMFYPISMVIGYLLGGWLLEELGWRKTFIVLGLPAIVVALIVKLTLKEPRVEIRKKTHSPPRQSMLAVLKILYAIPSFRYLLICSCVFNFFVMGTGQWQASFFIRSYGMGTTELGAWLALMWGVFGIVGNYLGGFLATRFAASQEKRQMNGLAIAVLLLGVTNACIYLAPDQSLAMACIAIFAVLGTVSNGPFFSAVQCLVPENMRSVSLALIFLFAHLIGFGFGPLFIGILSDWWRPIAEEESLRYALAAISPIVLWSAYYYWKAGNSIAEDIDRAELETARHNAPKASAMSDLRNLTPADNNQ